MTQIAQNTGDVGRMLAGTAKTIKRVRYCWLAWSEESGTLAARPMGHLLGDWDRGDWGVRFVTNGLSHKAHALRGAGRAVALTFQDAAADAYVLLAGKAKLLEDPSDVRKLWRDAFAVYFPTEADRAHVAFIELGVERMELWIRGVTPEPYGMQATILERDAGQSWRLIAA
jgi:general stress protein 26